MKSIPYQLSKTKDLLTSRAGLLCLGEMMNRLNFTQLVNQCFPKPLSNRGFQPSVFVNSVMLMLHEGGSCLDDLKYIKADKALQKLLGIERIPQSDSLGDWLRRMGSCGLEAIKPINQALLKTHLHHCKAVTLDIDATPIEAHKKSAEWTYKKHKGYMPMIGHIAETGQIIATDFREGNVAPATDNFEFFLLCQSALPSGVKIKALRIDGAGYQAKIIDRCIDEKISFAIRAQMSQSLKKIIAQISEEAWYPMIGRDGQVQEGESLTRLVHTMGGSQYPFSLVVQRNLMKGQREFDLEPAEFRNDTVTCDGYIYRAIATNIESLKDSELVHWYNQRGEHCENRIKELKNDFGAERMPCNDFSANALYFALCALAYNLFALLRTLLPKAWESCRAKTIRWRLYAFAGKVVSHGRKLYLKINAEAHAILTEVLSLIRQQFP